MLKLINIGKMLVCLLCCVACLVCVSPVSAFSTANATGTNSAISELPPLKLDAPVSDGQLVSYVRYSAGSGSSIIGCLKDGTKLNVLGTKGNYYKIDCYDMVGYIAKSQVTVDESGAYYVCAQSGVESTRLESYSVQKAMELKSQIVEISKKYIGVRYVYGGTTPRGFDCSGYTQYVYNEAGIDINRTARAQLENGLIIAKEDLEPGDLVIFSNTAGRGFASHVGIYLGNGKLIHASDSRGITIVDLDSTYFAKHYQCARRVILTDVSVVAAIPSMDSITGSMGSGWRNDG